jgi:hypothetical protein
MKFSYMFSLVAIALSQSTLSFAESNEADTYQCAGKIRDHLVSAKVINGSSETVLTLRIAAEDGSTDQVFESVYKESIPLKRKEDGRLRKYGDEFIGQGQPVPRLTLKKTKTRGAYSAELVLSKDTAESADIRSSIDLECSLEQAAFSPF